jgi:hypothetical protein
LDNEDLLRPTLSGIGRSPALYNSAGFFFSAFFGGPLGAVLYGAANSDRLGRLSKDVPMLIVVLAAAFLLPLAAHDWGWLPRLAAFIGGESRRNYELVMRALGLLAFGAIYLMHRQFFRAAKVSGTAEVSGWVPGIAAVVAGIAANSIFVSWLLKHH